MKIAILAIVSGIMCGAGLDLNSMALQFGGLMGFVSCICLISYNLIKDGDKLIKKG